uniref:Activator of Hsp90 ATPase N-terminal domain-containing protein n=2 Tax=Guillardia theta TaxID=55529 RepID=A0A7S4M0E0_GUITH|mmetsp:Transcript_12721/g.44549  ORF Transcript_12721/g.44549 Transcript_12721/m.44549 type:complete len:184 (+) Transcript_12721:379-930(+)
MAAGYIYLMSKKGGKDTKDPNALRSVIASKTIRTKLGRAYDYISTPDFRTEWHMGAVEVAGPAIDHSAVTGELFSEEMKFGGSTWHVDWTVLERQFPTSASTHFAEFVLEGKVRRGDGREQRWVESIRIKGDKNQEAQAVLVEMEVAVSGEGIRADEDGKMLRRSISRGLKDSLKLLRQRIAD